MGENNKLFIVIVLLVILVGAYFYFQSGEPSPIDNNQTNNSITNQTEANFSYCNYALNNTLLNPIKDCRSEEFYVTNQTLVLLNLSVGPGEFCGLSSYTGPDDPNDLSC